MRQYCLRLPCVRALNSERPNRQRLKPLVFWARRIQPLHPPPTSQYGHLPGQNRRPVYYFRSENREFSFGRCLIIADGFYEFTDAEDPKKKRKDQRLRTKRGDPWFCIAGMWQSNADVGEAFTMLTMPPGPDIAPYHDRQIAICDRTLWTDWLDPSVSARSLFKPLPAGTLAVKQVG